MTREPGDLPLVGHPTFDTGRVKVRLSVEVTPEIEPDGLLTDAVAVSGERVRPDLFVLQRPGV